MTWHDTGCCRESVESIDALGDLGNSAMTVTKHARNPARIGQPPAHDTSDLLTNRTGFRRRRLAGIEVVQLHIVAEQRRGRRKAANEIGDPVAIEKIALAVVLRMNEGIGGRHAGPE